MTESRREILSALENSESHPTADELHELVRARLPRISLGTIYRNLDILAREGLITVLTDAGAQRRYDGMERHHHHVRCSVCGRLDDVTLDNPDEIRQLLVDSKGYDIRGYTLCFTGLCRSCAEREQCERD
ncbi:MAG: transcriptional repressor [Candidatus Eisenbacteria bacterium]|nr:transcriptional repressor [Candidatus Eisenbacteria bacterium]